jgi:hypothetical protein
MSVFFYSYRQLQSEFNTVAPNCAERNCFHLLDCVQDVTEINLFLSHVE